MSKFLFVIFILNQFLVCSTSVNAADLYVDGAPAVEAERLSITWAVNPAPPFHILDGIYSNQGIGDVLISALQAKMQNTEHKVSVLPHSRIRQSVDSEENLCFPCVIKRSNNSTWVYSNETMQYTPLGIIALPDKMEPFLNKDGRVSLKALVKSNKLTFAQPISRKYPDALQVLVDSLKQTPLYAPIAGTEATTRVLRQLEYGRVDFTLEYPSILKYFTLSEGESKLQFYYTSELGEEKIPGAVGCTNNAWGKEAIDRINAALDEVVNSPVYRASQEFWQN